MQIETTPEQAAAADLWNSRPDCDWFVVPRKRGWYRGPCHRKANYRWGNRYLCRVHAESWIAQGKTMELLPDSA